MKAEVVDALRLRSPGIYLDCTLGGGGHAEAILEASAPEGSLIGMDRDEEAVRRAGERLMRYGSRVRLFHENYKNLGTLLRSQGVRGVDGILMDLGMSTLQLADSDRGFSFQKDGRLDMRMDRRSPVTAADLVNSLPERQLSSLLFEVGEERWANRIARSIVEARKKGAITTTGRLVDLVRFAIPRSAQSRRLHPATKTFQALRIAVNEELEPLSGALSDAAAVLNPAGRLCVISFHSLEDRIVKRTFKALSRSEAARTRIVTKKPIVPGREEIRINPRSRSAKLRVLECLSGESDEQDGRAA